MALTSDLKPRQYAEDIILNSNVESWVNNGIYFELPQPINFKKSTWGSLTDATAEAHPTYSIITNGNPNGEGVIQDGCFFITGEETNTYTPLSGFPDLDNYGKSGYYNFNPPIDAWGGSINDYGGFSTQVIGADEPIRYMPLVFFRTAVKKSNPSQITLYMAFPAKDTQGFVYKDKSNKIGYMPLENFNAGHEWTQFKSLFTRDNAFLIDINDTLSRVRDLPKLATISQTMEVDPIAGTTEQTKTLKYDLYELLSYDRYDKTSADLTVKFLVQGLSANAVTTDIKTWSEPHRFLDAKQVGEGQLNSYYPGIVADWTKDNPSNNPYNAMPDVWAQGHLINLPVYKTSLITLFEKEYTLEEILDEASYYSLLTTSITLKDLPVLTEYYLDTRSSNFYLCEGETDTITANPDKIYKLQNFPTFHPVIKQNNLPERALQFTKWTVQDGNRTLAGKTVNIYSSGWIGVGEDQIASSFYVWKGHEELILPGNALQGDLAFTCHFNIRNTTNWWYYIDNNGNKVYDQDLYSFSLSPYKYHFMVDMTNIPTFVTAIGTRYRNHNSKYAVLANNFDYFDYTWRGTTEYPADPTITLTLTYGDQVVASKTMDGTSAANQTFQHGPFLMVPTTEGQLVQVTGILTDARGRASAEKTFTITDNNSQTALEYMRFYNYNYPTALVQAYRCLADGTPDDENGTYVKLTATYTFSPVDHGLTTYSEGTADGQLVIRARPHSGTLAQDTWTETLTVANGNKDVMMSIGLDQSLDIQVTVTDFIGNQFVTSKEFVPSSQVVLDFRAGGEGLAIGKRNEFEKALEVAWDATFYGNVNFRGNVNITGATQAATSADAVTYYDTNSIGARNVQAAIDELAKRAGVSTSQVQAIVDQAVRNLDVPTDDHINQLITTKINNIVFPPSISEARVLELIENELANFNPGVDEVKVNQMIDAKTADFAKKDDLNPLASKTDLNNYYTKKEVDDKIAAQGVDEQAVKDIVDQALAAQPALTAENVTYGTSNVKEALDSMGTVVDTLPTAIDSVDTKVEDNGEKMDAIMVMLKNVNQTEWQDGNLMYF